MHDEAGVVDGLGAQHDPRGHVDDARVAVGLDHRGEREAQLAQALVGGRADDVDGDAAGLEVGPDHVGQLDGVRDVGLVQHDDPRALVQRAAAEGLVDRVGGELGLDHVQVGERVAARARASRSR